MHFQTACFVVLLASIPVSGAEVDLSVTEPSGVRRVAWPVTSGIPLARGVLNGGDTVQLVDGLGRSVLVQAAPLSNWPDGSIRWLLLDFQTDLAPKETKRFQLRCRTDMPRAEIENPVRVIEEPGACVIVTGPLKVRLDAKSFRMLDTAQLDIDGNGQFSNDEHLLQREGGIVLTAPDGEQFRADEAPTRLLVEESGPLRACVRIEGDHASKNGRMFRFVMRIHAFRGQSFLRMHYTFINDRESALMTKIESLDLDFTHSAKEAGRIILDGQAGSPGQLFQADDASYEVNGVRAGEHGAGWAAVGDDRSGLAVGIREFWQNWPKGIAATPGRLRVGICPDFAPGRYDGKPLTEECKLYYYLRNGQYSFKIGVARTHELWSTFFSGPPETQTLREFFQAAEHPLLAQCSPKYVHETRAAGELAPADPRRDLKYDVWVDDFFARHLRERDVFREYGFLNYGDWYNTAWDSWGNLEYDTSRIWFQQYLRTGDRRYFERAEQAARHLIDVDVLHATNPALQAYPGSAAMKPGQIWAHSVGHTGGYYGRWTGEKYEDEAPLKQKGGPQLGYWDHGHVWIGGAFDYYLLTGDRRAREVAVLASDTMAGLCPTRYTDHIRWIGWPLHMVLAAYEATGDPKYLDAATKQWGELRKHFDSEKGWVVLLAYGHCSVEAEAGRCRGNNMYMLGFTLTALARYHRITGDPEVLKALSVGLNQMISDAWSEEHKSFYLTSCRHAKSSRPPALSSPALHVSEALAYESRLTGNGEHRRILRASLQQAVTAGSQMLATEEPLGQTGYYAGIFHFSPFALSEADR